MKKLTKNGYTLVELVVVVAIFGMLFFVVSNIFLNSIRAATKAEAIKEVRQNGDVIMARMVKDLREAQVERGAPICRSNGGFPNAVVRFYESSGQRVQYERREVVGSPTIGRLSKRRYNASGGTESIEHLTDGGSVWVAPQPGTLVFTCGPNGDITITMVLEYIPFGNTALLANARSEDRVRMTFHTTVVNRNID